MGAKGVFRNVNILEEFNSSNSGMRQIYTPGLLAPYDIESGLKYSGFITSLRLTIDITSIPELAVVSSDLLASDDDILKNTKETFKGNPKKAIAFYLKTSTTPILKIADIYLFNQRPYYYLDLIDYFTSAATFDIASDAEIFAQQIDAGFGLLQGQDRVLLIGSVVEEAPKYEPVAIIQNITNNYTNTPGEEVDSVPLPSEIKTVAGDNDYVFMISATGQAYKILKTLFFAEIIDLIPGTPEPPPVLSGQVILTSQCSNGGTAFQSSSSESKTYTLQIKPEPGLQIPYSTAAMYVYIWSQQPNNSAFGRQQIGILNSFGGSLEVTLNDTYAYISVEALNDFSSYQPMCFSVNQNELTLIGYGAYESSGGGGGGE
ncbi:MAG: hypothetical protein N3E45_17105 [Oscillatoriaceae bacterium SKW80]|nr:hypothetical protein [Oscillatoriaceae bacterium SKW80]HIK27978.1 hypothetical protein [Oscillatoriaceae cyanobacterium M7585_C2015_266]